MKKLLLFIAILITNVAFPQGLLPNNGTDGQFLLKAIGPNLKWKTITATSPLNYNSSTGVFSISMSPTFTTSVTTPVVIVSNYSVTATGNAVVSGTNTGDQTNISGNAATVTTNANLTGEVTSVGNAASLGSFTSSSLSGALTNETGTGAAVFATSPTLVTPALGTPSALVGTNITGTASGLTAGNVTTNANLTGGVTSVGNVATVITNANLTGDITSVGNATAIGANKVTIANMATIATNSILGRGTAGTGNVEVLTLGTGLSVTTGTVNVSAPYGILGISNSSGQWTYYSTYTLAMAAATSGQTIHQFANITETGVISVYLKDGVNIQGNGFIYECSNAGSNYNFWVSASTTVNCSISNLKVVRSNSAYGCMLYDNAAAGTIDFTGSEFRNTGTGVGLDIENGGATIIEGINFRGYVQSSNFGAIYNTGAQNIFRNALCYNLTSGPGIRASAGTFYDSKGFSDSGYGIWSNGNAVFFTPTGTSNSGTGISNTGTMYNPTAKSISGIAIESYGGLLVHTTAVSVSNNSGYILSECIDFTGISSSSYLWLRNGAIMYDLKVKSTSNYAIREHDASAYPIFGATIICDWNNAGGYGIYNSTAAMSTSLIKCFFKLSNASADYIYNGGTAAVVNMAGNTYTGGHIPNVNITNGISATADSQGNLTY